MYLDFTDDIYRKCALNTTNINYDNNVTSEDSFLILLQGLDYETIENLCIEIAQKLSIDDPHFLYDVIQKGPNSVIDDSIKKMILTTAYEMIHANKLLGNKMIGKYNASSWISHCLFEGEVASQLAISMGLNPDTARKLGILHDVGRKFTHSFMHTIVGYEYLYSLGYHEEAICCLSHSFLPLSDNEIQFGNRCANCDPAIDGFYVDENGKGIFRNGCRLDDMTQFLNQYHYNIYDIILNIADLMATSYGIVSPYNRVLDVYSRKTPDPTNSSFFKVCFINTLNKVREQLLGNQKEVIHYNIQDFSSDEEVDLLFQKVSNDFIQIYLQIINRAKKHGNSSTD